MCVGIVCTAISYIMSQHNYTRTTNTNYHPDPTSSPSSALSRECTVCLYDGRVVRAGARYDASARQHK